MHSGMTIDAQGQDALAHAYRVLETVPDPEIPVLSLMDLGVIRSVKWLDGVLCVGVSPTYSGCPATVVIRTSIVEALQSAGFARVSAVDVQVARVRHRTAGRIRCQQAKSASCRFADCVPTLRIGVDREDQRVWFDAMQGSLPLQQLPRAFRLLQVHLSHAQVSPTDIKKPPAGCRGCLLPDLCSAGTVA
jgi:metal-sulfur cluster biosynthetic enzyme